MGSVRLLVLGGTAWLGSSLTADAVHRGHDVTCLARGESGSVPAGARFHGADRDRPGAYDVVADETWDAVIDVSRQPGQVRRATAALAERAAAYVFISSGNVYADHAIPGSDEAAELLAPLAGDVMETMKTYGEAKVACELHVRRSFGGDRTLIARAGLIGGPGDIFDRTGYWPLRFARPALADGSVLVPDVPVLSQVIDVRDLAAWLVESAERGVHGVVNAVGETMPLAEHLAVAREVAGHTGPLVTADQDWLLAHDVEPWMGPRSLPLWLQLPDYAGFNARDGSAARATGLTPRPLAETLADTLAWELTRDLTRERRSGLGDDDERELISARRG